MVCLSGWTGSDWSIFQSALSTLSALRIDLRRPQELRGLPRVVHTEVALDPIAPAAIGAIHCELVAGLGIEAEAG
jgi:hypothetical protein